MLDFLQISIVGLKDFAPGKQLKAVIKKKDGKKVRAKNKTMGRANLKMRFIANRKIENFFILLQHLSCRSKSS